MAKEIVVRGFKGLGRIDGRGRGVSQSWGRWERFGGRMGGCFYPLGPALSLVLAVLNILAVPIGTTISILTFWVFREDLERMFCKDAPGSG